MKQASTGPQGTGFRALLQAELARRCCDNEQYSLRAFARDLGIDHSSLSQILRGRRGLTGASIQRLGAVLGLTPRRLDELVEIEQRSPLPGADPARVQILRELSEDMLAVISEPEHFALLELTHVDGFRPDVRWIARVLGLAPDTVNLVLQRLLRLQMLEFRSATEWVDLSGDLVVPAQGLEAQMLRRLAARLQDGPEPGGPLEYSSTVLSIDRARVREVGRRLARCRAEILALLDEGGPRDAVYRLELAFVPLTRPEIQEPH